jgi:hypothetical protein
MASPQASRQNTVENASSRCYGVFHNVASEVANKPDFNLIPFPVLVVAVGKSFFFSSGLLKDVPLA